MKINYYSINDIKKFFIPRNGYFQIGDTIRRNKKSFDGKYVDWLVIDIIMRGSSKYYILEHDNGFGSTYESLLPESLGNHYSKV